MSNTYLNFISDQDLFSVINTVFVNFEKKYKKFNINEFEKNLIDPFSLIFSEKLLNITDKEWFDLEIIRKKTKSLSNYIGTFQEELLGCAADYHRFKVNEKGANSMDLIKNDNTVFADIKNKYNTIKGSDRYSVFNNLQKMTDKYSYLNAKGYYVEIISKESVCENWKFTSRGKQYCDKNIYRISGDKFYSLVFGVDDAFYQVIMALPIALTDFINQNNISLNFVNDTFNYNDLLIGATEKTNLYEKICFDVFKSYDGFEKK